MGPHLRIGELGTLLLVVAVSTQGFQLVVTQGDLRTRALGTTAVALLAFVIGIRYGRQLYRRERIGQVGWLPKKVTVHEEANGNRHALVTQNSGDMISIPIPPDITRAEDIRIHVLVQLNEGQPRRRGSGMSW